MFIPLRKVDAAQRLVYGSIDETPDRTREVFDYDTSKPNFAAWSAELHKASDGKSFGNVRAMHKTVAAGKLESIAFDDNAKRIDLVARIVDDAEWEKVEAGVYTGFSPGGKYEKRWKDGEVTRYTAKPSEISLVDLPCIPSATFTLVKGEGLAEERPFKAPAGDLLKAFAAGDYLQLRDLLASKLRELFKLQGQDDPWPWVRALFADHLVVERDGKLTRYSYTADGSTVSFGDPVEVVVQYVPVAEAAKFTMALAAQSEDLAKVAGELQDARDQLAKVSGELTSTRDQLVKASDDLVNTRDALAKVDAKNGELIKRVAELEAQPAPGGPILKTVGKEEDVAAVVQAQADALAKVETLPPEEQALALMKIAQSRPVRLA
jgi:hypothetical protein